jgi:tetratricopeptide (TPR) repeat protein
MRRYRACAASIAVVAMLSADAPAAPIDLAALWDFSAPAESERRFREALKKATGDDALVLQTQIARTYGLRAEFDKARAVLGEVEPRIAAAGPEARARYWLELGRTYASGRHAPESVDDDARRKARAAYDRALEASRPAQLDGLTIDALHMYAFVDTAPAAQLAWSQQALVVVEVSTQAEGRRWEASIRNNIGESLFDLGRHEEALVEFRKALALREQGGNSNATRHARAQVDKALRALGRGR